MLGLDAAGKTSELAILIGSFVQETKAVSIRNGTDFRLRSNSLQAQAESIGHHYPYCRIQR